MSEPFNHPLVGMPPGHARDYAYEERLGALAGMLRAAATTLKFVTVPAMPEGQARTLTEQTMRNMAELVAIEDGEVEARMSGLFQSSLRPMKLSDAALQTPIVRRALDTGRRDDEA